MRLLTSSKPEDFLPVTTPSSVNVREDQMKLKTKFGLLFGCLMLAGGTCAVAQGNPPSPPQVAQVVALDECDPVTFKAAQLLDCKLEKRNEERTNL